MAERRDVAMDEHEHVEHHSHLGRYLVVWAALSVLTFATYGIAKAFHIPGGWGVTVALVIAVTKGTLVSLFFMHLWDQRGANRLVFVTSLFFVALLIGIVLSDNATRFPLANPPGSPGALPTHATDYPEQPLQLPPRAGEGAQHR
jgi:cytochrome c oxidase subunit 4